MGLNQALISTLRDCSGKYSAVVYPCTVFELLILHNHRPTGAHLAKFFLFLPYLVKIGSPSFRRKVVQWMPWKLVRDMQKNVDAIDGQARNVYNLKKEALLKGDDAVVQQVGSGKDIMSILCELYMQCVGVIVHSGDTFFYIVVKANLLADEGDQLPEEELISQMK